jgi:hypothetical protein
LPRRGWCTRRGAAAGVAAGERAPARLGTLLRGPSLFDELLGQNDYLDEFVRVHQTIAWPKHLDERLALVQRYSWALPTDDAPEVIARYAPVAEQARWPPTVSSDGRGGT